MISANLNRREDLKHTKDCQDCKQTAKDINIRDILTLAVWDDSLRPKLKKA